MLMWLVILGVWARFAFVALLKAFRRIEKQVSYPPESFAKQQISHSQNTAIPQVDSGMKQINIVAVVGATSMVGQALLPMLKQDGIKVIAYSRKLSALQQQQMGDIEWRKLPSTLDEWESQSISNWVWVAPIKALPQQLENLRMAGARHVVALSTTSRFTKKESSSVAEREFVEELIAAEESLQAWAKKNAATWTILRPTLIYGLGLDKNIGVIARFIRRFHFFPILGKAEGLRQPIHARDVAAACKAGLESNKAINHDYNISGAEKLTYRVMVERIFKAYSMRPHFFSIPLWMFSAGVATVRVVPQYRSWSAAMAERMNQDMVFDYEDAVRDLNFSPQAFKLDESDLPEAKS
jgi:nucleoside-diphosphate-sugar epimerase